MISSTWMSLHWWAPDALSNEVLLAQKYRTEYRKLIVLFLNRNFLILPDTRITPYRPDTLYRAVSDTVRQPF